MNVQDSFTLMSQIVQSLYTLAESQSGYFTTAQAAERGVTRQLLAYHCAEGNIDRAAHGIYRLRRYPAQPFEDLIVACLWVGPDAVVSHETALAVYGLGDAMPATIHVTVPRRFRGRRPGARVHHASLPASDRSTYNGVPITSVERTLIDVAAESDPSLALQAAVEALERGVTTRRRLLRRLAGEDRAGRVLEPALGQP